VRRAEKFASADAAACLAAALVAVRVDLESTAVKSAKAFGDFGYLILFAYF
jgi:hypothetical protein